MLDVEGLGIAFDGPHGAVPVVSDVALTVAAGEAVALVGESGCGKSVTARAILGLLPTPPARVTGRVALDGVDLLAADERTLRRARGEKVGFVFQDPMTALNPVYRVGEQIAERLRRYGGLDRKAAAARAVELLASVGIPAPAERARAWPHELSGGMRQRVVIAIALACDPALLIADEPTTALDVTVQAQIMALLRAAQRARGMGLLLITHDLGLVAQHVDRVVVMYAGQVVEEAPVEALFAHPRHPYTRGLLRAVPGATPPGADGRLWSIPGAVPAPRDFPAACRFAPRCPRAQDDCRAAPVPLTVTGDRAVRCLHPHERPISAA
ncbi:MAG: ABC transporter ATP-binding protein [Myxococcales bacterium]|nr:ABC transporter ATP-binding protein [Myxococcales bacterium]